MKHIWQITSVSVATLAIAFTLILWLQAPKVGVIDNARLLSEFKATQEAQQQMKASLNARKFQIDSMGIKLKTEYERLIDKKDQVSKTSYQEDEKAFLRLRDEYGKMSSVYQNQASAEEQEKLAQITTQLNAYVQEFAKTKGYDYILGANGSGNVWYMQEGEDITDQVIEYANRKYEGE
ncbi:MAG: OmpH family outer membrane protein [Bacteroidia bacterium]